MMVKFNLWLMNTESFIVGPKEMEEKPGCKNRKSPFLSKNYYQKYSIFISYFIYYFNLFHICIFSLFSIFEKDKSVVLLLILSFISL